MTGWARSDEREKLLESLRAEAKESLRGWVSVFFREKWSLADRIFPESAFTQLLEHETGLGF